MRVLLFAALRDMAGASTVEIDPAEAPDVAALLALLSARYGPSFARVAAAGAVVVGGEPADPGRPLSSEEEVAVLPPVSGGRSHEYLSRLAPGSLGKSGGE